MRVLLRDMQEQIIRGLKSANKGSKIWTPYFLYVEGLFANRRVEIILGHDVRIKVVFDYECPLLEPRILTNPRMIQTGHIWFFQLAVCFWVLGLPLFVSFFFVAFFVAPGGFCWFGWQDDGATEFQHLRGLPRQLCIVL